MSYSMSYTSLVGDKNTSGSIARWVNYSKLDADQILQEAQSLIYSLLRIREMRAEFNFTMALGQADANLPARFLDPIGRISFLGTGAKAEQRYPNFIQRRRVYTETSGTLGSNPFTTTSGSTSVIVNLANHGFNNGAIFTTAGATAFNGVTIAGSFIIVTGIDANNFQIDITPLGTTPNASGAGGGSSVTYTNDNLIQGTPLYWGIWSLPVAGTIVEALFFDCAFARATTCNLQYFQSLPILSSTNPTNFLTNRYPHLLRKACTAQAWDFLRNDAEYQKDVAALTALVEQVNAESDMSFRGAAFDTYLHDE